jgi:hypothetical protein
MSNQVRETLQDALDELGMAKRFDVHACHACACLSGDASNMTQMQSVIVFLSYLP